MCKKMTIFIAVCLFATATVSADVQISETNFPDPNFRAWILQQPWGSDGVITDEEIASVGSIDVSSRHIFDLTGINFFTNLTTLLVGNNQLTSLDVSNLTNLTFLSVWGNQLTSLDVSNLTNLTGLNVGMSMSWAGGLWGGNRLTSLDVSNLTSLTSLNAYGNLLTSLDVSNLINLTRLEVYGNRLTSLDVTGLTNLFTLDVRENFMTDESDVIGFLRPWLMQFHPQATIFEINETKFPDPNFRNWLSAQAFVNDNITTHRTIQNIGSLMPHNQNISDLTGIEFFANLRQLNVLNNQLVELDVSNLTNLTWLSVGGNQLTSLDVSNLPNLQELNAWNNQLVELDVSNLPNLWRLDASNNQLASIDLLNLPNLRHLNIMRNQLTELYLPNLPNLTFLMAMANQLTSIDVSNLPNLRYLFLNSNQLTSLDVSGLPLAILYVSRNHMRDHSDVIGFSGEWDTWIDYYHRYVFNPQIRVITEINEENFPDENLRNWLLEQNDGNTDVYIREEVWIVPEDEICNDTEIIHTDVIEDCSWTASNIVSARIIEFGRIDNSLLPGNINCNNNQTQHDHAFAVWEIVREFGDGTQETITQRVYYCLDGRNPASTDNRPFLAFMSVVCVNPFYTGNNENNLRGVRQQTEISIHTFSALAVLNDGTNVVEIERAPILHLHPNPAQDFVNITADFPIRKIEIFSLSGVRVFAEENPTNRIDLRSFAEGVYFVRVYGNGGVVTTQRLIVR